jgi:hypothetical protein
VSNPSVKLPAASLNVTATALPEKLPSHVSQAAPAVMGAKVSLGTYTTTL